MRRKVEEAKKTREKIIEKAIEVFIRKGYSQTTQEDIVKELSLTRGAFNWHFKGKTEILEEIVNREFNYISNLMAEALTNGSDTMGKLEAVVLRVVDNFFDNKKFRDVVYLTWFRVEIDPASKSGNLKTNFMEFFIEELIVLIDNIKNANSKYQNIKAKQLAAGLTAILFGVYRLYFVTPEFMNDKELAKGIVKTLIGNTSIKEEHLN